MRHDITINYTILDWKKALACPIFKKGDRKDPSNYQPVSLTSVCCTDGNELYLSEAVKSSFRQGDTSVAKAFSNSEGMRSGPEDFVGSSSLSSLAMPATSKSIDGSYFLIRAILHLWQFRVVIPCKY